MRPTSTQKIFSKTDRPEDISPYIALALPKDAAGAQIAHTVTSRLMHWHEDIWLLDLKPCLSYWSAQASLAKISPVTLLHKTLREALENLSQTSSSPFAITMADHPWVALLLIETMKKRHLSGLIDHRGPFGQSLYREISWSTFWQLVERLGHHMESQGRKGFRRNALRRHRALMQRAVQRLSAATPQALWEIKPHAIQRRFGALLRDIWDWTYFTKPSTPDEPHTQLDAEQSGFPWRSWHFADRPKVTRHLDYPICDWSHIQPLLREDLTRLCLLDSWRESERVMSLEWRVVFRDLTRLTIPIPFRHPHPLHSENPHQNTALLQALYAFEKAIPGSPLDPSRLDDLLPTVPITSWDLEVTQRLTLTPKILSLFNDTLVARDDDHIKLMQLENRLSLPLMKYCMLDDWLPEDSFSSSLNSSPPNPFLALAASRPLFIYKSPILFDNQGNSCAWKFSERTMDKWWSEKYDANIQRDYYHLIDHRQRNFWVFKDNRRNRFYIHGVYS